MPLEDLINPPMPGRAGLSMPKPMPGLQGLITPLENEQQALIKQAYTPGPKPSSHLMTPKQFLLMALASAGAALGGAKGNEIGQGIGGYLSALQARKAKENRQAEEEGQLNRQRILTQAGLVGDKIRDKKEEARYQRGIRDKKIADERNFNQQRILAREDDERAAKLAASKKKSPWENLQDDYLRRISDLKDPQAVMEAGAIFRKWVNGTSTPEEVKRLDELTFGDTNTADSKRIKNEFDRKWKDKNAQQQFDLNVKRAGIMDLDKFAKEFRNEHLDDELIWKWHLMKIGATNQLSLIQDRDFQNRVAQNKRAYDVANATYEFAEKEVKRLEAARDKEIQDMNVADPAVYGRIIKHYSGLITEAKRVRDEAIRKIPDPLEPPTLGGQGLGNTPPNWNPGAPGGLPGVINPNTGQEAGLTPPTRAPGVLYESTTGLSFKDDNGKDVTEAQYAKMTPAQKNRAKQRAMGINPNPTQHVPYQAGGKKPTSDADLKKQLKAKADAMREKYKRGK